MTKYLRDVEKIFLAGNTQIECKEDLAKIVEEPCLAICEDLYDKNILTYWSSANKDAPNHAFVLIRYESLDERNKAIADKLINEGKIKEVLYKYFEPYKVDALNYLRNMESLQDRNERIPLKIKAKEFLKNFNNK
jgi:hypothetical protein